MMERDRQASTWWENRAAEHFTGRSDFFGNNQIVSEAL
jgi:hypothetical protein